MASSRARVALVTGSTSGIGLGITKAFAKSGFAVIVTGFRGDQLIKSILDELHQISKAAVHYVPADLSKAEEIEELYRKVKDIHPDGIDILVNNAGTQHRAPIEEFPLDIWNQMMSTMLTAPFHLIKLFLPDMKKRGWGRIVNNSSAFGKVAGVNRTAYISAKHGLIGLTKAVAMETATSGVTCNAICLGIVETPMAKRTLEEDAANRGITPEEAKIQYLLQRQPTLKMITVEQVAETVKFICSPAADQMTGSALSVDGGWTAK
ncbi:D-beta-hydroxybutyrate dehydrogenase-like [Glandiceps talaboti]